MASVQLQISRTETGEYLVVVSGEGFYRADPHAKVGVRIKGDDKWFDDTLFTINLGFPGQILPDGTFIMSTTVSGNSLNEDWGQDEIYALATVDGFGEFKSNVVTGYF